MELHLTPRQEEALLLTLREPLHAYYGLHRYAKIHPSTARSLELHGLAWRCVALGGRLQLTDEGRAAAEKLQKKRREATQ